MIDRADLFRTLGALAEPAEPGHAAIAGALGLDGRPDPGDYAEVFLFGAYPYASVYLGPEGMLGGEARDRIAGFWRAVGLTPPPEPDHLAALLGMYAGLMESECAMRLGNDAARAVRAARAALRRESRKAFLWEHLVSWLWPYLDTVERIAPAYHRDWARLLRAAMAAEIAELGPADRLPQHLRAAPGLPAADAPAAEWVAAVLAPVRSGMVLTRRDLGRGAASIGIATRVGERAFMLRSMLEQDGPGTIEWLAAEAAAAAGRHRRSMALLADVGGFWRGRAEATQIALRLASTDVPGRPVNSAAGTSASPAT